jgi:hypothetical protein
MSQRDRWTAKETTMRNTVLALALSAAALGAATATAQAGGYGYGHGHGYGYGYKQAYTYHQPSYSYEPVCFFKKRKVHDGYGYFHFETVKVCR